MEKLVRDKIPALARANGEELRVRETQDQVELWQMLKAKLVEETQEFLTASSIDKETEEFGDILEVITAIFEQKRFTVVDVERMRSMKAQEKGLFKNKTVLKT